MRKTVLVKICGHIEIEVNGNSEQDILQNADTIVSNMDFGQLEDIDWAAEIAPWED